MKPLFAAILLALPATVRPATLAVGPGQPFAGLEAALAQAAPGDTITVEPLPDGRAYAQPALLVRTKNLVFRSAQPGTRVKLDGRGYDYAGHGRVPRAIFQFDRGADGCVVEGFELYGARNSTHNGAAVRVNQANAVTVRDCDIHDNDMGIMSNGDAVAQTCTLFRIECCRIHHNGSDQDPGFNHNLYLGGTSVILTGCEIFGSTTGHNVKSRAHYTRIEYCYVHDSANREFDLVDDKTNTGLAGSDAVLLGNLIVKAMPTRGNRTVIHFGQDGGHPHRGTLRLAHNTVVTGYAAPVVELSAAGARAALDGNLVANVGQPGSLAVFRDGASAATWTAHQNWFTTSCTWPPDAPPADESNRVVAPLPSLASLRAPPFRPTPALAGQLRLGPTPPLPALALPAAPGESGALATLREFAIGARPPEARPDADAPLHGAFALR